MIDPATANHARYLPGQRAGHYESFFQRGNHPTRPLAFWIRYTLFTPDPPRTGTSRAPGELAVHAPKPMAELWAIFFDGETGAHVAVKRELPLAEARFDRAAFSVRVAGATLGPAALAGAVATSAHRVAWDLRYHGDEPPIFLLPPALYDASLPRAKSLVGLPLAVHEGTIDVDGRVVDVGGWVGSQNHNWGSRHTDHYAWGQVAGFDGHPGTFLEIATARLRLGPVWTPFMTLAVLRHEGKDHVANGPAAIARARGSFGDFAWRFSFEAGGVRAAGTIEASREDFVGLAYANPPGGVKDCLNTKIAGCDLTLTHPTGRVEQIGARRRAAFEILTDDHAHGVPLLA